MATKTTGQRPIKQLKRPDLVAQEMKGKAASVIDKAQKQVASAIENARDYAQAVIDTLTKSRAA